MRTIRFNKIVNADVIVRTETSNLDVHVIDDSSSSNIEDCTHISVVDIEQIPDSSVGSVVSKPPKIKLQKYENTYSDCMVGAVYPVRAHKSSI